jgi:hypothetical protein
MKRVKDSEVIGQRFGRLVVKGAAGTRKRPCGTVTRLFLCECDCGNVTTPALASLRAGNSTSCGCARNETLASLATHGNTRGRKVTGAYSSWAAMLARCENPKNRAYPRYGGNGVTVCVAWHTFEGFLADMGERPAGLTIERIKNSVGYAPGNCRWATCAEQSRNTARTRLITLNGKTQCISDWAAEIGVDRNTIQNRIDHLGWPIEQALSKVKAGYGIRLAYAAGRRKPPTITKRDDKGRVVACSFERTEVA